MRHMSFLLRCPNDNSNVVVGLPLEKLYHVSVVCYLSLTRERTPQVQDKAFRFTEASWNLKLANVCYLFLTRGRTP